MKIIIATLALLSIVSCAHSIKKGLGKITPGMTRSDVVDKAGSPLYVHRKDQKHIWVYRYYDHDAKEWVKQAVFFEKGIVLQVADAPERSVVLKNGLPQKKSDLANEKTRGAKGAIKERHGIGSEDWYQEIKVLEKKQLKNEKLKVVPTYKKIN